MPESETETGTENKPPEHHEPPPQHLTLADLEAHKREIMDELSRVHREDTDEREKLKAELAEAREWIEERKKADAERDKVKSSQHTLVLPPSDIPAAQPNTPPTENHQQPNPAGAGGDSGKRRRSWRDFY